MKNIDVSYEKVIGTKSNLIETFCSNSLFVYLDVLMTDIDYSSELKK